MAWCYQKLDHFINLMDILDTVLEVQRRLEPILYHNHYYNQGQNIRVEDEYADNNTLKRQRIYQISREKDK